MTEYEQVKQLFGQLDIEMDLDGCGLCIVLQEGAKNVEGYCGFYVRFEFDEDGKFRTVGIYE